MTSSDGKEYTDTKTLKIKV